MDSGSPRRAAGIDAGTNSFKLCILERDAAGERVVLDRIDLVRLGEGVDASRRLAPAAIDRCVAQVVAYRELCAREGVAAIAAVGTSALRDAANADTFLDRVAAEAGVRIEVISGEREAELTYSDVTARYGHPGRDLALLDIGGGSSEVVLGRDGQVRERCSIDVGSRRLAERAGLTEPLDTAALDRCRAVADELVEGIRPLDADLVGTGGTITTLAALHHRMRAYDPATISATWLDRPLIAELTERLAAMTLAEREATPGMEPKRADIIVPGALLLERLLLRLGAERLAVSAGGLRMAVAREALADA